MAEYLEREKLIEDIEKTLCFTVRPDVPSAEIRGARKVISLIEAASGVEICCCEECLRSRPLNRKNPLESDFVEGILWCEEWRDGIFPKDFCSYAVRRGE